MAVKSGRPPRVCHVAAVWPWALYLIFSHLQVWDIGLTLCLHAYFNFCHLILFMVFFIVQKVSIFIRWNFLTSHHCGSLEFVSCLWRPSSNHCFFLKMNGPVPYSNTITFLLLRFKFLILFTYVSARGVVSECNIVSFQHLYWMVQSFLHFSANVVTERFKYE